LVEHFSWFHQRISPRESGIVRYLEGVVDAIIKVLKTARRIFIYDFQYFFAHMKVTSMVACSARPMAGCA
jgi:hypothetical protein